jgi:hypothetical protein
MVDDLRNGWAAELMDGFLSCMQWWLKMVISVVEKGQRTKLVAKDHQY